MRAKSRLRILDFLPCWKFSIFSIFLKMFLYKIIEFFDITFKCIDREFQTLGLSFHFPTIKYKNNRNHKKLHRVTFMFLK